LWIVKVELINYSKFAGTPSCIFCMVYCPDLTNWIEIHRNAFLQISFD
jgi:Pyruvate/2-oxoacid:ferredoxin oxidoreductase delta subunit